jgi:uncharacterized zinc-type alcohol dehydrogenase-like protein
MISVKARATAGPGERFQPLVIERRDVGPNDVLIDIAYAGICHTDISHARSEWGPTMYPLVPGHEIAGTVAAIGDEVTRFQVGDRVGVGVMVDSCRECSACKAGEEQHCTAKFVRTYNWLGRDGRPTYGGYSEQIVVDQDFVVRIPDNMSLAGAAPLLCAGITMYSPMRRWKVGPGTRLAILGFGGLGHVGVQLAKAMGAHTTVLEVSPVKRVDAVWLGADDYRVTTDEGAFDDLAMSFDVILSTVPASLDLDAYMGLLDRHGVFVNIGVSSKPLCVDPFSLLTNARAIAGSSIGGIAETQEMLDFCSVASIGAVVEVIAADQIDEAYRRIDTGDVRYRFVIETSTLDQNAAHRS